MKNSIIYALLVSTLGYAFVIVSALVVWIVFSLTTGYYPSFTYFTLALITFRLAEIHYAFFVTPPLVASLMMMLLSRTAINRRIVAGISLSSLYFLVALMYVMVGAGEFPMETSILWILWVFVLGLGASIIVDRLSPWHYRGESR